jgi:SAM-dependent methyltransferase
MSDWSSGYNVDVAYTHGFYKATAPAWLNFIATFDGVSSPRGDWRYLELGCGNGFGLILLAALHPDREFVGVDFNPTHIAHGRGLAEDAGLSNVWFFEADFVDIAQEWPKDWGQFDYIVAHGVIAWLTLPVRKAVIGTIDHAAKPGALVYLSYNCMPGQAPMQPVQHLLRLWQTTEAMKPMDAISSGMRRFQRLIDTNSTMTKALPMIKARVDDMKTDHPHYLVHEYLHDSWHPLWFDEVVHELRSAKLAFLGSTEIGARFPTIALPPKVVEILEDYEDPVVREVMLDVVLNRHFRKDVFARGATPLWPEQHETQLSDTVLCRGNQKLKEDIEFDILAQSISGKADVFRPFVQMLETGPTRISDLLGAQEPPNTEFAHMRKSIMYLLQSGFADLHVPIADTEPAKRLNKVICNHVVAGASYSHLIASENGTVLKPDHTDMIMLAEVSECATLPSPEDLATKLVANLKKRGKMLVKKDATDIPPEGMQPYAISLARSFLSERYQHWQTLGIF